MKWKNDNLNCVLNIRFYDQDGKLIKIYSKNILEYHNEINLTNIFKEDKDISILNDYFSVEAVILSLKIIGYPFPALTIFTRCTNSNEVTCVHSGGRVENSNELKSSKNFEETNWLALNNKDFTTFFHFFNSGTFSDVTERKAIAEIIIAGKPNLNFKVNLNLPDQPFSSKIYYLHDYLSKEQSSLLEENEFFINLKFTSFGVMRLIVGNYHF